MEMEPRREHAAQAQPIRGGKRAKPGWIPQKGSQELFLGSHLVFEVLYGGTRGPGKTDALLMSFAMHVGRGYGNHWRGIIFRRTYPELKDIINKSKRWFNVLFMGAEYNESKNCWTWSSGEQLYFAHMRVPDDYWSYHGHEYPFIGWEELTTWADDACYRRMMSCCRSSSPHNDMPRMYRATTNPYGPGHCLPYGEVLTDNGWVDIKNMRVGDTVLTMGQDGKSCYREITDTIKEKYEGDMVSRKGRELEMVFTENHRLPYKNSSGYETKPFRDLPGQADIVRTCKSWEGQNPNIFTVPDFKTSARERKQPRVLEWSLYCELMGWFLSNGHVNDRNKEFGISRVKSPQCHVVRSLLKCCGFQFREDLKGFTVSSPDWWAYMRTFGKFIPRAILNSKVDNLRAFVDSAMQGSGHRRSEESGKYYTTSKQLSDDMAEIFTKIGHKVFVSFQQETDCTGLSYAVNFNKGGTTQLHTGNYVYDATVKCQSVNVERSPFDGYVYCITVPETEVFFVRQNGCVWLSGNTWVKRRFQLPQRMFEVFQDDNGSIDPQTGKSYPSKHRLYIHGVLTENKILLKQDPDYMNTLRESARNEQELKAWVEGSWDVISGGMFSDVFNAKYHVVKPFPIPESWRVDRAFDWGGTKPFSLGWYAESDGMPYECPETGKLFGAVAGDIFRLGEWYGTSGKSNEGLGLTATEFASQAQGKEKFLQIHKRCRPGPADHNIFARDRGPSMHDEYRKFRIRFEKADKGQFSRQRGWDMVRNRFKHALPREDGQPRELPGLYIFDRCRYFLELVPNLPRSDKDPDDIDTDSEDHIADELRYRIRRVKKSMQRETF